MAVQDFFRRASAALFSKPTPERQLLKIAKQSHVCRVVELGIDSIDATLALLKQSVSRAGSAEVTYTGFDSFDERPENHDRLSLIGAHRKLSASGARVRLQPGGAVEGMPAAANSLQDTDLVLLSLEAREDRLAAVWFYLPRMCHPGTQVLRRLRGAEPNDPGSWEPIDLKEVNRLAAAA